MPNITQQKRTPISFPFCIMGSAFLNRLTLQLHIYNSLKHIVRIYLNRIQMLRVTAIRISVDCLYQL